MIRYMYFRQIDRFVYLIVFCNLTAKSARTVWKDELDYSKKLRLAC